MTTQPTTRTRRTKRPCEGTTIALVGNPNVGKSTLFNGVTGARQAVMNAPGTTVEVQVGTWKNVGATILDLPGTYSLVPNSPDEKVVADTLSSATVNSLTGGCLDLVLAVLDGGALTRSLYLVAQLAQTGYPLAAIISMADVAADNGITINPSAISRELGIPVLVFDPRKSKDYPQLDRFIEQAIREPKRVSGIDPDPTAPGYSEFASAARVSDCRISDIDSRDLLAQTTCPCEGCNKNDAVSSAGNGRSAGSGSQAGTRASAGTASPAGTGSSDGAGSPAGTGTPAGPASSGPIPLEIGGLTSNPETGTQKRTPAPTTNCGCGHSATAGLDLGESYGTAAPAQPTDHDPQSTGELQRAATLFSWVDRVESAITENVQNAEPRPSRSDRVDHVLLNPFAGPLVFLALMWLLFKLAGEWIGPIQDLFDSLFTNTEPGAISLANGVGWLLSATGLSGTWLDSLLINGLVTGLGVVASFVPLMFTIFAALSILEDSGYMARAAFLADRLMRRIGLDGRVVLPLIMGFGCNLPSLAAARTLPSASQRLVTVLITPYTSCAARLTIYLMIAKIFFPNTAGTVVFGMYVVSLVLVVVAAWVLKQFITKHDAEAPLMLILPAYQVPRILVLLRHAVQRSWIFIKGAGKIIVAMTMVVWLLGAIPMGQGAEGKAFADPELAMEHSAYGQAAKLLEPVFEPAGFGDWHMTGALMTGFVAKETVVSSIVTSYNMDPAAAGDAEDNGDNLGVLPDLLSESFTETAGEGYQGLAAIAFLVFVLAYTPCMATVAEQARLIGGRKTAIAVVVQLAVAWALAVGIFQIGKLFL